MAQKSAPFRQFARSILVAICLTIVGALAGNQVVAQQVNVERLKAAGFTVTQSDHLTLVTDVRDRKDVTEFNDVFEQAVDQWCEYFSIPKSTVSEWHITCSVILDKDNRQNFTDAGLMNAGLPLFPAGYQSGDRIWVYLQDGDYYTRHLLIHEGTHAFMEKFLGGYGAPWYAEGMAELLGVHQWKDGKLTINHQIQNRDEVPYWGRVKLVRKERDAGSRKTLDEVLAINGVEFQRVKTYGWAWAACEFFNSHPDYQETFRKLPAVASLSPGEFNRQFRRELDAKFPAARLQWEIMVDEIEYGYDVAQAQPVQVTNLATTGDQTAFDLAVDRGWQTTDIQVVAGQEVQVTASGMFQVKHDGDPWPCDAGGVTLEYYQGQPLGRLLVALRFDSADGADASVEAVNMDASGKLKFNKRGTIWMRINESPAAWSDNNGVLKVVVNSL